MISRHKIDLNSCFQAQCPVKRLPLACCALSRRPLSRTVPCWRVTRCIPCRYAASITCFRQDGTRVSTFDGLQEYLSDVNQVDTVYLTVLNRASGEPLRSLLASFVAVTLNDTLCLISIFCFLQPSSGGQMYCSAQALPAQVLSAFSCT